MSNSRSLEVVSRNSEYNFKRAKFKLFNLAVAKTINMIKVMNVGLALFV